MRNYAFHLLAAALLCLIPLGCGCGDDCPEFPEGPVLTSVDPTSGLVDGGETVTLTGAWFGEIGAGTPIVRFGGHDATNVTVVDGSTITCTTPPHPAGLVRVEVKNAYGWAELEDAYRYRPPPVTFEVADGGIAGWSSEVEQTPGVMTMRFETPDTAARAKAILPYVGTLGEITTFHYDVYSNLDNYAPFIRIELEADPTMAPATKVVLVGEPVYTTGWNNLPASTWHTFDCLALKFVAYEIDDSVEPTVIVNYVDCPWDQPTLTQYITGDAMTKGNFCANPNPWSTAPYGPLVVLQIAVQAGYGGPWAGFVGYADAVTVNDRTYDAND